MLVSAVLATACADSSNWVDRGGGYYIAVPLYPAVSGTNWANTGRKWRERQSSLYINVARLSSSPSILKQVCMRETQMGKKKIIDLYKSRNISHPPLNKPTKEKSLRDPKILKSRSPHIISLIFFFFTNKTFPFLLSFPESWSSIWRH